MWAWPAGGRDDWPDGWTGRYPRSVFGPPAVDLCPLLPRPRPRVGRRVDPVDRRHHAATSRRFEASTMATGEQQQQPGTARISSSSAGSGRLVTPFWKGSLGNSNLPFCCGRRSLLLLALAVLISFRLMQRSTSGMRGGTGTSSTSATRTRLLSCPCFCSLKVAKALAWGRE